jgi:hypothetical protein
MRPVRSLLLVLAALATVLLPTGSAAALSYPVTSTADADVKGTLRGSIEEANADSGADSIPIQVTGTIELKSALPEITESLTITGPGADALTIERDSTDAFRVLTFADGADGAVSDLTVRGGLDPLGAGILNGTAELTLLRVVVADNEARAEEVGAVARGGGVASYGALALRESTIYGNEAIAEEGGSQTRASGGGIAAFGSLTLERSTVSGNVARALAAGGNPAVAEGGGIQMSQGTLTGSTVAGNEIFSDGVSLGANLDVTGAVVVRDTLLADPSGDAPSCGRTALSGGFNLDEDGSCGFGEGSDLIGMPAGLDPLLQDNGGPTPTHALLAGSVAIDRGNSFGATVDQRGLPRPSDFATVSNKEGGDGSDIGAFELQAPPAGTPHFVVSAVPGDRTPPNTRIVSGPSRTTYIRLAKFRFASSEAQSRFQCKVDQGKWRGCRNPFKRKVSAGGKAGKKHVFKVRAIDRFGNADPTPARFGWRVKPLS